MVRRSAAVLIALVAAQVYVLVAPELPAISDQDASLFVASALGLAAIVACCAAVVPISDERPLLTLVVLGMLLIVAVFNAADLGAAASPAEGVAYSALGAWFATALLSPALALTLPLFVAGIDVISTLFGGPSELLADAGQTELGDPLSLEAPDWGNGLPAGRLGISDAVFAGVFLAYARRLGLRELPTAVGLWVALVAAVGLHLYLDATIPALPLMAAAYFLVNLDRLPALLRRAGEG